MNTKLNELYNDASFIFEVEEKKTYSIAGVTLNGVTLGIDDKFRSILQYIIDLYESLDMIGFETDINIADISEQQERELNILVSIRRGKFNSQLTNTLGKYIWHYNGLLVPLILQKDNKRTNIINAVYTDKWQMFIPSEENEDIKYRMPIFICQDADTLSNLYEYNFDYLYDQIDKADINTETSREILDGVLSLIKAYDKSERKEILDLAEYMLDKIKEYLVKEELYVLNKIQIKKRNMTFSKDDENILRSIVSSDDVILFGKYVLLDNYKKANEYFNRITANEKEIIMESPIYNLYKKMIDTE